MKKHQRTLKYNGGFIRPTKAGTFTADLQIKGKPRTRLTLKNIGQAKTWIDELWVCHEAGIASLSTLQTEQARQAFTDLPNGVSLQEVVKFYLERNQTIKESLLVAEAAERYIAAKIKRGLRPAAIRTPRNRLNRLVQNFPQTLLEEISLNDLLTLLDDFGVHGQTWNNYRSDWSAFWNWCISRDYVCENPAKRIEDHATDDTLPDFFGAEPVETFMRAVECHNPELAPYYAMSFFAGVRSGELNRMTADLVKPELIRVTPENAKTRQMRHIEPCATLQAWLRAYPPEGRLVDCGHRYRSLALIKRINLTWKVNGGRHSFATHDLELNQNASQTAHTLGHPDANLLYSKYRGLTTRAESEAYFGILPT